jgi:hypothetical protein
MTWNPERPKQQQDDLRRQIRVGIDQLERGEYRDYDQRTLTELAERIKKNGRKRLAQGRSKRS